MKYLIVAEKPAVSHVLARYARALWPDAEVNVVSIVPLANIKLAYPRGHRLSEYPLISAPVYSLATEAEWIGAIHTADADGRVCDTPMNFRYFEEADVIIQACDPDYRGAAAFETLMRLKFGDDRALSCPSLRIDSIDDAGLSRAFVQMRPFGISWAEELAYARVKNYFDWNWNVNGFAVLGGVLRAAGVESNAPPLSKYSLQLLYALRARGPMSEDRVIELMQNWKTTGRYRLTAQEYPPRLGSVVSHTLIVLNLLQAGMLNQVQCDGRPGVVVSEIGKRVLAGLHPNCEDVDLPFRLEAWCQMGMKRSESKIDRYIRTFFGRQLRYQAAGALRVAG